MPTRRVVTAALGGLAAVAVIPTIVPIFAGGGATWIVLAGLLPTLVAVVSFSSVGRSREAASPFSRLVVDVVGTLVLLALAPRGADGSSAISGIASGAKRLAESALPATPGGAELGVVMVAVALAAGIGAELAGRRRRSALPLAPSAVLYAAAVLVGAGGMTPPLWGAVLLLAAWALILASGREGRGGVIAGVTRERPRERPLGSTSAAAGSAAGAAAGAATGAAAGLRSGGARTSGFPIGRIVAAGGVIAVVCAVSVPLGRSLPGSSGRQPYDLRAAVDPAPSLAPQTSLLSSYAATYDAPPSVVFTVDGATGGNPVGLYWRLETFDHFTGSGWTSTDSFQRAADVLPPGPHLDAARKTVTATVTLAHGSVFLPAPDRPVRVSGVAGNPGPDVAVSTADGVIADTAPPAGSMTYRLEGAVADPTRAQLLGAAAEPASDPGSPPLPAWLLGAATKIDDRAGPNPFARLTAISSYLTGGGFVHHTPGDSPIGSGLYQVSQLLQTHDGSAEQYASAFALLARASGFDARIAIGYYGGKASRGTVTYTTRNITVWPEVELKGLGWVPFPAVPTPGGHSAPQPGSFESTLNQALATQKTLNASSPHTSPANNATTPVGSRSRGLAWWVVLVIVVAVLALVAAGLVVAALVAKGRRRRSQRHAANDTLVVLGAWEWVLDRLVEAGVPVASSDTTTEVVGATEDRMGAALAAPLTLLAPLVDETRYDRRRAPHPDRANEAWQFADAFGDGMREATDWRGRLKAAVSPAPWRRGRPATGA